MAGSFKTAFCCFSLLAILLSTGCSGNDGDQERRPNILLILVDDLGNNDLASWGDGAAPTPTLDRLSRQSVRFRQHYTDSTCSPSRAALLTGKEPASIGFQPTALGLSPELQTLPEQLQQLGYRTMHLGKWHVGEALEYEAIQPSRQGFDYWFGMLNHFVLQGPDADGQLSRKRPTHWNPWLQENGTPPRQFSGYLDDILTDRAIGLMGESGSQPWFINLWLYSPHAPTQPPVEEAAKFPGTPEGKYRAVLSRLDHNVSRLLAALEASGQADNTVVVFASDNGGTNETRDSNWPFDGAKGAYLEGGQRSPLLLKWPGHLQDRDVNAPTTIMDLYPTLVALAGGQSRPDIDGRNLLGLLGGDEAGGLRQLSFAIPDIRVGMSYGVRLLDEGRLFYRPPLGPSISAPIAPPVGEARTHQSVADLSADEAQELIRQWERGVRVIPLDWQPAAHGKPARLSGRSLQRAPVFAGYSMGLALHGNPFSGQVQTLVEQEGVWHVQLLADRRLRVRHGAVEQFSAPLGEARSCNELVIATQVTEATSVPYRVPASSVLRVTWNGETVLDSARVLQRPRREGALMGPTLIGARADGSEAYVGEMIDRPVVVNKFLYSGQEGFGPEDMRIKLCSNGKGEAG